MSVQREIRAVGIDLGTTFSAVSYVSETGQTIMLSDELGAVLTPSVVHFDEHEIVVGQEAVRALSYDWANVATSAKRDMGEPFYSRTIQGKTLPPEVLAAYVLTHLRRIIERQLGEAYQVVLTVPAFFDENRRRATALAGRMAGLDVIDIINEPTAAALAFGEQLGYLDETGAAKQPLRVLVFDLGGGTFDVTIVELGPDGCKVLATDGDVRLGGDDWDQRIAIYMALEFEAQHGLDPRSDPGTYDRLRRLADSAKRTLSVRRHATVHFEFQGQSAESVITRKVFESLTADLLERTVHTVNDVLSAARLDWPAIDRVLLVGGAARMPMIAQRISQLTGQPPEQSVNPDEAVARGAAIYAAFLLSRAGIRPFPLRLHIVDVNSHSLGIEGVNTATNRRENAIIIPRNTPLPAAVTRKFVTKTSAQPSILVHILEGEHSDPSECISIGRATLRGLPSDLPIEHPLEVTFAYDHSGRLRVHVKVPGTDRHLTMELQRAHSLSPTRIDQWSRIIQSTDGFRSFDEMLASILGSDELPGDAESGS